MSALLLIVAAGQAIGENTGALDEETDSSRYQLQRDGDDFVRLDRQTGEMSVCTVKGEKLVCRMAADERSALMREIDDLQSRLATLEKRVPDTIPEDPEKSDGKDGELSEKEHREREPQTDSFAEEEIDRVVEYSSKVLRKFFSVMKELREDLEDSRTQ